MKDLVCFHSECMQHGKHSTLVYKTAAHTLVHVCTKSIRSSKHMWTAHIDLRFSLRLQFPENVRIGVTVY